MLTIFLIKDHYQLHKTVFKKTNYGFQIFLKNQGGKTVSRSAQSINFGKLK